MKKRHTSQHPTMHFSFSLRYQIFLRPGSPEMEMSVHLIRVGYVHTKLFSSYPQNENSQWEDQQ